MRTSGLLHGAWAGVAFFGRARSWVDDRASGTGRVAIFGPAEPRPPLSSGARHLLRAAPPRPSVGPNAWRRKSARRSRSAASPRCGKRGCCRHAAPSHGPAGYSPSSSSPIMASPMGSKERRSPAYRHPPGPERLRATYSRSGPTPSFAWVGSTSLSVRTDRQVNSRRPSVSCKRPARRLAVPIRQRHGVADWLWQGSPGETAHQHSAGSAGLAGSAVQQFVQQFSKGALTKR